MYRPYMYAYYILYVYGQSLILNAIPCVSMCDNKIYLIHTYILLWVKCWSPMAYKPSFLLANSVICTLLIYTTCKYYGCYWSIHMNTY